MNLIEAINPVAVYIISSSVGMIAILACVVVYRQSVNAVKSANDLYERGQE